MELLVSVRSVSEAEAALAGGAGLIDVKEPARGSLGRADEATVAAVMTFIAGRRPVSAALGELADDPAPLAAAGLSYVKWGLAGCGADPGWCRKLEAAAGRLRQTDPGCGAVAAAYADWQRAQAPPPGAVADFACGRRWAVLLIDTWRKDGSTLTDWLSILEVEQICRRCRGAGVGVALAGSLGLEQVRTLRDLRPDWLAVRGAACREGRRQGEIDPEAVRRLANLLGRPLTPAPVES